MITKLLLATDDHEEVDVDNGVDKVSHDNNKEPIQQQYYY